jgi:hypothetical protein
MTRKICGDRGGRRRQGTSPRWIHDGLAALARVYKANSSRNRGWLSNCRYSTCQRLLKRAVVTSSTERWLKFRVDLVLDRCLGRLVSGVRFENDSGVTALIKTENRRDGEIFKVVATREEKEKYAIALWYHRDEERDKTRTTRLPSLTVHSTFLLRFRGQD